MKIRSLIIVSLLLVANFISLAQASPYVETTTKSIPDKDIKTIEKQQNNESIDVDLNEVESRNLSDIIEAHLPSVIIGFSLIKSTIDLKWSSKKTLLSSSSYRRYFDRLSILQFSKQVI